MTQTQSPPNNSLQRSANRGAFISEACVVIMSHRAALIRVLGGGERGDITMSLYTHWACFDCRKSFHNPPLMADAKRTCPECGETMWDMGVYFEPLRRQARKAWTIIQLLAESGY